MLRSVNKTMACSFSSRMRLSLSSQSSLVDSFTCISQMTFDDTTSSSVFFPPFSSCSFSNSFSFSKVSLSCCQCLSLICCCSSFCASLSSNSDCFEVREVRNSVSSRMDCSLLLMTWLRVLISSSRAVTLDSLSCCSSCVTFSV